MLFQNLDFFYIQCGIGCVSNCFGCNRKEATSSSLDEEKILNIITTIHHRDLFANNIFLYNRDITTYSYKFLQSISKNKKYFSNIYYHTSFDFFGENKSMYEDNQCIYQRDIDSILECRKLKNLLKNNFDDIPKAIFVLWYDDKKMFYLITKILKEKFGNVNLYIDVDGSYSFCFENKQFKIFPKNGLRQNINYCFFEDSIKIHQSITIDRRKFPSSGFEITINGDISLHELPCGKGSIVISNIYKTDQEIRNDFLRFSKYIGIFRKENENQKTMCLRCNGVKYYYEK